MFDSLSTALMGLRNPVIVETLNTTTDQQSPSIKLPFIELLKTYLPFVRCAPIAALSVLETLVIVIPGLATDECNLETLCNILLFAVRLPPISSTPNVEQPAVHALKLLSRFIDLWSSQFSMQQQEKAMSRVFDMLRIFPTTVEHAETRLFSWWHFICHLPDQLLEDGFRRFLSPFLSNLLGRYLSLSAPDGNPELHRYKLSQGGAYEGNYRALQLLEHVFASFFLDAGVKFRKLENALYYWVRLLSAGQYESKVASSIDKRRMTCFPSDLLPNSPIDVIWIACVNQLVDYAVDKSNQNTMFSFMRNAGSAPLVILQHAITTTCQLLSPPSAVETAKQTVMCIGSLSRSHSLNIIEALVNSIQSFSISSDERDELMYMLCLKLIELGGSWLTSSITDRDSSFNNDLQRWANISSGLVESVVLCADQHIIAANKSVFLSRFRAILQAFLPDCLEFAAKPIAVSNNDASSQDSTQSVIGPDVSRVAFSTAGLQLWSTLVDQLTHFVVREHCISASSLDTKSNRRQSTSDYDPVFLASLLAPLWLAGPTPPASTAIGQDDCDQECLSGKDELTISKRLNALFIAFHQEACLLTCVPTNAWIDQLGCKLSLLIHSFEPHPEKRTNLFLVASLLRSMAQNAELVNESVPIEDSLNPYSWHSDHRSALGHLNGLLLGIKSCLQYIPWLELPSTPVDSPCKSDSGSRRRLLMSPECIASRLVKSTAVESSPDSQDLVKRLTTDPPLLSAGLVDALDALILLVTRHVVGSKTSLVLSSLTPLVDRLVNACIRVERLSSLMADNLDESLLITKRRQQAKQKLEQVFITIWQSTGLTPVSGPDLARQFKPYPKRMLSTTTTEQAPNDLPVSFGHLLESALKLYFIDDTDSTETTVKDLSDSQLTFLRWLIASWNSIINCLSKSKTRLGSKEWQSLAVDTLVKYSSKLVARLGTSDGTFHRRRIDSTTTKSGADSGQFGSPVVVRSRVKSDTVPSSAPSKLTGRGRRGRLSLVKQHQSDDTSLTTTPVKEAGKAIQPCAPQTTPIRRGGVVRDNQLCQSPSNFRSPKPRGILAKAFGIPPPTDEDDEIPVVLSSKPLIGRSGNGDDSSRGRKRRLPDPDDSPVNLEESAQFTFIPPSIEVHKRRRKDMTSHQLERYQEQRSEYIPAMYTDLDGSQQSLTDSQSQSQMSKPAPSVDIKSDDGKTSEPMNVDDHTTTQNDKVFSPPKEITASTTLFIDGVNSKLIAPAENDTVPDNVDELCSVIESSEAFIQSSNPRERKQVENDSSSMQLPTVDRDTTVENKLPLLQRDIVIPIERAAQVERSVFNCVESKENIPVNNQDGDASKIVKLKLKQPASPLTTNWSSKVISSPLLKGISSRAQRMLALGLQKAAEQRASACISPSIDQRAVKSEVKTEQITPPGILRSLSARKRPNRVSFADSPMIFEFDQNATPTKRVSCPNALNWSPLSRSQIDDEPCKTDDVIIVGDVVTSSEPIESTVPPSDEAVPDCLVVQDSEDMSGVENDVILCEGTEPEEPTEVADTQEMIDSESTRDNRNESPSSTDDVVGQDCFVIEESQLDQPTADQTIQAESPIVLDTTSHQSEVVADDDTTELAATVDLTTKLDVEVEISQILAKISLLLPQLEPDRRQAVLMQALTTFKSVIP